jgi:hypothetical protein
MKWCIGFTEPSPIESEGIVSLRYTVFKVCGRLYKLINERGSDRDVIDGEQRWVLPSYLRIGS